MTLIKDLSLEYFKKLRQYFFDDNLAPCPFYLKLKKNTQDDPFDDLITSEAFSIDGVQIARATGPLITPDFVLYSGQLPSGGRCDSLDKIIAIENKRVESKLNEVPRLSSIDFNSTPPSSFVRVFRNDIPLDIRSFYLLSIIKDDSTVPYQKRLDAICLVDGAFFNTDFNLYLESTSPREKKINVGSFEDGIDRVRPMFVFPNPLSLDDFSKNVSLIHSSPDLATTNSDIRISHEIVRYSGSVPKTFYSYRMSIDCDSLINSKKIENPFSDKKSKKETSQRGKFKL